MNKKNAAIVIQSARDTTEFASVVCNGVFMAYDPAIFSEIDAQYFDSQYWQDQEAITGFAKGRGTTWFFQHRDQQLVLRHYYRGGMIGKVLTDQYFSTGLISAMLTDSHASSTVPSRAPSKAPSKGVQKTRAYREFALLAKLRQLKLPVPAPAAIAVKRKSLFYYSNDIITTRIEDTDSLAALLSLRNINDSLWRTIGATIRRFHDHKVFHHDLNAHNILIDPHESCWLIDFDQGEIRSANGDWQQANIDRLKRSLDKEQKLNPAFHFHESNWKLLLDGYNSPK